MNLSAKFEESETEGLHVHLVANGVIGDSRVIKSAQASDEAGVPSIILGVSTQPDWEIFELEGIPVYLVPVGFQLVQASDENNQESAGKRWPKLFELKESSLLARGFKFSKRVFRYLKRKIFRKALARKAARAKALAEMGIGIETPETHSLLKRPYRIIATFTAALDILQPTSIHVHDTFPLASAIDFARMQKKAGKKVSVVYDSHEWVEGLATQQDASEAFKFMSRIEHEYIREADTVITVSAQIAELIQNQYDLTICPGVVLNAPTAIRSNDGLSVRREIGLSDEVPLLVYSGWIDAERGLDTTMKMLARVPEAHLAIVANSWSIALRDAMKIAKALKLADRIHIAGYVAAHQVAEYLSSADVGILPRSVNSHLDFSLPTKFREYLHAGLPLIVSTNKAMADEVHLYGFGEVFNPENVEEYAAKVRLILEDAENYRSKITPTYLAAESWESQIPALLDAYWRAGIKKSKKSEISVQIGAVADAPNDSGIATVDNQSGFVTVPSLGYVSLAIGPANYAGQAFQWARAARDHLGVRAKSFGSATKFGFEIDREFRTSAHGLAADREWMLTNSHIIVDAFLPVVAGVKGADVGDDLSFLMRSPLRLALLAHGSEIRNPHKHMERNPESYFRSAPAEWVERFVEITARNAEICEQFGGQLYVSTPDLLHDLPTAEWLPLVVSPEAWQMPEIDLTNSKIPTVLHAPSRSVPPVKGSEIVVPVLQRLHDLGRIRFISVEGLTHNEMPELLTQVDIVVDQIKTGSYGVAAVEAMHAGRLVVGSLTDDVKNLMPESPPIVNAFGSDFERAFLEILDNRDHYSRLAEQGKHFAKKWHDGQASALILEKFARTQAVL